MSSCSYRKDVDMITKKNQIMVDTRNVQLTSEWQRVYAPLGIKFDRVIMCTKDNSPWEIVPKLPEEGEPEGFPCNSDNGMNPLELGRNNAYEADEYIVIGYVKGTGILAFMYIKE